jgi:hypothetical protein
MSRIAVTGPPKTGKTVLSLLLTDAPRSTDDAISGDWSRDSETVSRWLDDPDPDMVLEGVTVPRALRKWLARNPTGRPVDEVRYLDRPYESLDGQQQVMGKGIRTVMREIAPELRRRGVRVTGL